MASPQADRGGVDSRRRPGISRPGSRAFAGELLGFAEREHARLPAQRAFELPDTSLHIGFSAPEYAELCDRAYLPRLQACGRRAEGEACRPRLFVLAAHAPVGLVCCPGSAKSWPRWPSTGCAAPTIPTRHLAHLRPGARTWRPGDAGRLAPAALGAVVPAAPPAALGQPSRRTRDGPRRHPWVRGERRVSCRRRRFRQVRHHTVRHPARAHQRRRRLRRGPLLPAASSRHGLCCAS